MSQTLQAVGSRKAPGKVDFYPTPPLVTNRLLDVVELPPGDVWEPCCGAGHISKVLEARGRTVISSDLFDQGYGQIGVDALETESPCSVVLTNPAFSIARRLIGRLFEDPDVRWFCLMTKSQFWHAGTRTELFRRTRPSLVLAMNWRQDPNESGGSPTMDHIWTVWDKTKTGECTFDILEKTP